jgi:hypothetical protein
MMTSRATSEMELIPILPSTPSEPEAMRVD